MLFETVRGSCRRFLPLRVPIPTRNPQITLTFLGIFRCLDHFNLIKSFSLQLPPCLDMFDGSNPLVASHVMSPHVISWRVMPRYAERHDMSCPVLSCPVPSRPVPSHPILCCPVLSCPVLSCPVLSCPVLSCPVLSCPVLSCPVLSCPVLPCQVRSGQVRSGQVRSGQVRSGQVRSGQVRSGQVRSGQVRSGNDERRGDMMNEEEKG